MAKRRRLPPEERKQEILQAAARLFASRGYHATSVSDVIDTAGIARGTFYLYFESKKDVFLELIESYFSGFAGVLESNHERLEAAFRDGTNPLRAWRENILSILSFHANNPELTRIVYREAMGRDEDFSERVEELSWLARGKLVKEFKAMSSHGLIRDSDVDIVASIAMGATVNIIMEHLLRRGTSDLESVADALMDNQVRALAAPGIDVDAVLQSIKRPARRRPAPRSKTAKPPAKRTKPTRRPPASSAGSRSGRKAP